MVIAMDNNYYYTSQIQNRLLELWQNIDKLHMSYLEMDESAEKLNHRILLEDCIRDFLCIATHKQKFIFHETTDVLQRSANKKKDFSAYKAATGWNALQMYASNLLAQPWRKEYREVKSYSGFYKHQIEANLIGAEIMFEAMGYKHFGDGILVLDGPICPDTLTNVSKDCLVAYVECQILKLIWEEVKSTTYKISWLEVLDFRRMHPCSPEQAIKTLKYQYQQKLLSQQNNGVIYQSNNLPTAHSFPPLNNTSSSSGLINNHFQQPYFLYGSNNGCCSNNIYGNCYPPAMIVPPVQQSQQQPQYISSYGVIAAPPHNPLLHYHSGVTTQPPPPPPPHLHHQLVYGYGTSAAAVPTGQLIELDPSSYNHHQDPMKIISSNNNTKVISNSTNNNDNDDDEIIIANDKTTATQALLEDWDYVYRNLESQGYSKDLGERGDILSLSSPLLNNDTRPKRLSTNKQRTTTTINSAVKMTNLDDEVMRLNGLTINNDDIVDGGATAQERPLKINEALERFDREKRSSTINNNGTNNHRHRSESSSSYENLSSTHHNNNNSINKTRTLPRNNHDGKKQMVATSSSFGGNSQTLDGRRKPMIRNDEPSPKTTKMGTKNNSKSDNSKKWHCKFCTYLNDGAQTKLGGVKEDICEMCSKSRVVVVEQRMEVGGAQCAQCTLVNPKDSETCQACNANLADSPTYI